MGKESQKKRTAPACGSRKFGFSSANSASPRDMPLLEPVSKAQIQLIKIGQKELGIDEDDYRAMLMAHFRVNSCTQLTKAQATRLIERFEALGFETRSKGKRTRGSHIGYVRARKPRREEGREGEKIVRLANHEMLAKIDAVAALIDWEFKDGLQRWMQKRLRIERVKTAREAWLAIEGLKKMFSIKMAKNCGKDWWTKQFDDPRVMRFIKEHCPEEYR